MPRDMKDNIALILAVVIGAFLLLSLVGVFVLAWNDKAGENLWSALFALATALLGGVTGYLAGAATVRRNGNGHTPGPVE
jgi:integral membrane sensor domain MASE1